MEDNFKMIAKTFGFEEILAKELIMLEHKTWSRE
jgi:hypothetical protein